jgi:WD40 repeat protein
MSWSPDGTQIASASLDNSIIVWDVAKFGIIFGFPFDDSEFIKKLEGHTGFVKGVAWDPIGRFLASEVFYLWFFILMVCSVRRSNCHHLANSRLGYRKEDRRTFSKIRSDFFQKIGVHSF